MVLAIVCVGASPETGESVCCGWRNNRCALVHRTVGNHATPIYIDKETMRYAGTITAGCGYNESVSFRYGYGGIRGSTIPSSRIMPNQGYGSSCRVGFVERRNANGARRTQGY